MQQIGAWLHEIGKSREWFAQQTGVALATVNGWFSQASSRPIPPPTDRLIERLMQDTHLGEPRFTIPECNRIRKAMQSAGYVSFCDFARDAVNTSANQILSTDGNLTLPKVADEPQGYPEGSSRRGRPKRSQ